MSRVCHVLAIATLAAMGLPGLFAGAAFAAAPLNLHLANGGQLSGELRDSAERGIIRWQATPFVSPFEFRTSELNAIQWPAPAPGNLARPSGDFCFELAGGDVVFGSLIGLNDQQAMLDVPRLGRFSIRRSELHRIYRWRDGADLIYVGPNGLNGWREPTGQKAWVEELGQPMTSREGASIYGDFGLPARVSIEFEISWKNKPDFVFALGVEDRELTIKRAFRFEAWGGDLVIQRELEAEADLAVVQDVAAGPGRTHLQAYLDQQEGRILVFSPGGRQLAHLKVVGTRPSVLPGLYLANIRGDVRLEWLRVGRWNGDVPREARAGQSRIHRADGSIVYGQVNAYLPASKEFVLQSASGDSRIPSDQIGSIFLSAPRDDEPRMIRAVYQDGSRLSGDLVKVEQGAVVLAVPGVPESLRAPLDGLRSLVALRHESPPTPVSSAGRLEMDGVRLSGKLVEGREQKDASCLVWHPLGSTTASALRPGASGKIVYREPPPPAPVRRPNVQRQPQMQGPGGFALRFAQALAEPRGSAPGEERRSLFLRTGDVIPSQIVAINEEGVTFRSSLSSSTFVPHERIKAVELSPETTLTVRLSKSKRERLLTLPRMQKASPPTHLIRSKNGDYLRGRVVMMDDKTLAVETRLETKELPRDRISRIIWLHADELDPAKKPPSSKVTRVQAVRNDGVRVTFFPEQFTRDMLSGKSDVIGACHVRLGEVDQLLFGDGIEQAAALLTLGQWKLQNAPEPIEPVGDNGSSPGGGTGTESPLVGKPAPDFELELLDGKRFRLTQSKGKVVVLDFWATWCGPCIQAMPQVEKVTSEFPENDVQLVAVNLQETKEQIKSMMERHKLHAPRVALDKDGTIAEKYGAVAIPQTVVIGREGTVARLFVGCGPHLGDQLRDAIKATLAGQGSQEPKK
jgi:peroxiredoxin